jgi:hypothetical protein
MHVLLFYQVNWKIVNHDQLGVQLVLAEVIFILFFIFFIAEVIFI